MQQAHLASTDLARTILLVEDEAFVREVACEVLSRAGYRVLKAGNAKEAVKIFREHAGEVHLLLTDVVLPDRNGRDLATELAALGDGVKSIFRFRVSGEFDHKKRPEAAGLVLFAQTLFSRVSAAKN